MNYINQSLFSLLMALVVLSSVSATAQIEEHQQNGIESGVNLNDGASEQALPHLGRDKKKDKWTVPDWIKKAAEKQEKRRAQEQDFFGWDDFDDEDSY